MSEFPISDIQHPFCFKIWKIIRPHPTKFVNVRAVRREHSGLCDRRDLAKFAGKPPDRGNFLTRAEVHAWQDCPDLIYLTRYEKMYSVNVAIRERKLPLSRSSTQSSSF